jgi:hypothetical protein
MKTIQPIQSWNNGQVVEATILNAYAIQDNLTTSATFWYAILDNSLQQVSQGNLTMTGDDYTAYETNLYAWDWVASSLKLTIIGEYVAPVIAEPIIETSIISE